MIPFLTENQKRLFFGNLETVIQTSQYLIEKLKSFLQPDPSKTIIGSFFIEHMTIFKNFSQYISTFSEMDSELLKLYKAKNKLTKIIKVIDNDVGPLDSFLVKPIQRMPQYVLLLKEIRKATPTWHSDYELIAEAIRLLEETTQQSDAHMRESLAKIQLYHLQKSIKGCDNLVAPFRTLLFSWTLRNPNEEIHLLTDMVLISEKKKDPIKKKEKREIIHLINLSDVLAATPLSNGFTLSIAEKADLFVEAGLKTGQISDEIQHQMQTFLLKKTTINSFP